MIEVVYQAVCRVCDWKADPKLKMDLHNQAEKHAKATGHYTITTTTPKA